MSRQDIRYQTKDINRAFQVWLFLFLILCTWNVSRVAGEGGNLAYLHLETMIIISGYWLCNFAYTLILFGKLWDGERISIFPLFILLQLIAIATVHREHLMKFLKEEVQPNQHLSVPFLYTIVVYLVNVVFLRRLKLYSFDDHPVVPENK